MSAPLPLTTILIDLDDTLYPASSGIFDRVRQRIYEYMRDVVRVPEPEIQELRERLYHTYGTTLRGLMLEYGVDMATYLAYVHGFPLDGYLRQDAELRAALESLPQTKWVFTNASAEYGRRILQLLGIADLFSGIIDVVDVQPYCKPMPESFEIALRLAGCLLPGECLLVDDTLKNLEAAQRIDMRAVLVAEHPHNGFTTIPRLADLPAALYPAR